MIRRTLILLTFALVSATPALAAERLVLENGLVVIHDRRPTAPAVSLSAYVRAGSVNESSDLCGASHFVEHMMFRATGRRPDGGSELEVWRVGGHMSAFTHEDYTEYGILVPSEEFPLALDILSDALTGAAFRPVEVEEERVVILEEIRKRAGDPEVWAFDELQELTFAPHPYGGHLAGTEQTIARLSRADLHQYYLSTYRPERCTLVLVGDFDPDVALPALKKAFGTWKGEGPAAAEPPALPREFGHYQELTANRSGASPTLLLSMTSPEYGHPDYLASRFLREVLEGWLVQRLVIEQRVAIASSAFHTPLRLGNRLRIRLNLSSPEGAAAARDALLDLLHRFSDPAFNFGGVPEIAANYQARETLLTEDFSALAPVIGRAALWGYYHEDGYPEHLAAVDRYTRITADDLRRVAKQWLCPENMRVFFLLPKDAAAPPPPHLAFDHEPVRRPATARIKRISTEEGPAILPSPGAKPPRDSEAARTVLANGLRLIHLERAGAPVVAGAIVLPAGSRFDPPGKEGLAWLTLKALSLATAGDTGGELRWDLYALGNAHGYSVGRDTAKVTFTVPKSDSAAAIRLFSEILRNPSFTDAAIEEARGRQLASVRRSTERVSSSAGGAFRSLVFGESPYAHDHRGTEKSLSAITRDDVVEFYRRHYDPGHAVVALVGEIAPRTARRLVEQSLGLSEERRQEVPAVLTCPPPKPSVRHLDHASGRTYLILGSSAPASTDPRRAETDLLRLALGWQVFHEFTDVLSTAYNAGAFYDAFAGAGAFGLYVSTSPSRAAETRVALTRILEKALTDGLPAELVKDARGAWLGGFALSTVKALNAASRMAVNECVGAGFDALERVRQRIETISPEELSKACRRLLAPDRLVEIRVN